MPFKGKLSGFISNIGNFESVLRIGNRKVRGKAATSYNGGIGKIAALLDFVARFNDKYVIGEAKFLTDFVRLEAIAAAPHSA